MSGKKTRGKNHAQRQDSQDEVENILIRKRLKEGKNFFEEGNYIEAIEKFAMVIGTARNDQARQYLARCFYRLEKYEKAYDHFLYLADHATGEMKDYAVSMIATIEEMHGNIDKAIKILRDLPKSTKNLINLSIMYWKKYKAENSDYSVREAMSLLDQVQFEDINDSLKKRVFHLRALIYQTQNEHRLAKGFYKRAIKLADNDVAEGRILNDYASLFLERKEFDKARELLDQARTLVKGKSKVEEAFNNKWTGFLLVSLKEFKESKTYLESAAKVLREKDLLEEAAVIDFIMAKLTRDEDFYKAAEYFAKGIYYEKMSEEVTDRDEKILDFYLDSFFGDDNSDSGTSG